jgi:hypothetical protein
MGVLHWTKAIDTWVAGWDQGLVAPVCASRLGWFPVLFAGFAIRYFVVFVVVGMVAGLLSDSRIGCQTVFDTGRVGAAAGGLAPAAPGPLADGVLFLVGVPLDSSEGHYSAVTESGSIAGAEALEETRAQEARNCPSAVRLGHMV